MFNSFIIKKAKKFFFQKLWSNNSILAQLLGLCPILAISSTVINALGLGLTMTIVLFFTNIIISAFRNWIPNEIRIPIYIIIISSIVSIIQILINAYVIDLYQSLGIFIPLIITNCIIISRAEIYAVKNKIFDSAIDALSIGFGTTIVLFFLGAIREILGNGTLFTGADLLLGEWAASLYVKVLYLDTPFLLAMLPPGAFIGLGLMLAGKCLIDKKIKIYQSKNNILKH